MRVPKPRKCSCKNCQYCTDRDKYERNYASILEKNTERAKLRRLATAETLRRFESMEPDEILFRVKSGIRI